MSGWHKIMKMKRSNKMELVLFLKNGETLKFEQVENFEFQSSLITFTYTSASNGKVKSAMFKFDEILGMATEK